MKLPRQPGKWIRDKCSDPDMLLPFMIPVAVVIGLAGMWLLQVASLTDDPTHYCRCLESERQRLEEARMEQTVQEVRQRARQKLKAVRTPAAERVRRALKEWEREQAEREAAVRAAVQSMEVFDAAAEPAADVAPR